MLVGRHREIEMVTRLIDSARARRSQALVLRGPAGIGKTAVLEHAIGLATDFQVLRVVGLPYEQELAFSAVHQLCAPLLENLEHLPQPQRSALQVTFGLSEAGVPDPFMVGLAVLTLVAKSSESRPLLCVIDDAQWLDLESAKTLSFMVRRLMADAVAVLFATRESTEVMLGLPELVLQGVELDDARKLLRTVVPWPLDERLLQQLFDETQGNPLALLELSRTQSPQDWAGGYGYPAAISVEGRVEAAFLERVQRLSEDSRRLLLLAAAHPSGELAVFWAAAERLRIASIASSTAEASGLLSFTDRVQFRHPLARSAIYGASPPDERRRVHQALAQATDPELDPERHAWHRARSTLGPDEEVAAELAHAAVRARARGGLAAAAAFLEQAATRSLAGRSRTERALAAADLQCALGALEDARSSLQVAEAAVLDELQQARVRLLHAQIAFASRKGSDAPALLLEAARALEAVDPERARMTYLEAFAATLLAGRLAPEGSIVAVAEAVLSGPLQLDPGRPEDRLLHALAVLYTSGLRRAAPAVKEALTGLRREAQAPRPGSALVWLPGRLAGDLWDEEAWYELSARDLRSLLHGGALAVLPVALSVRAFILAYRGELDAVESIVDEMAVIVEVTGVEIAPYAALVLAAVRGRAQEFMELFKPTVHSAMERGEGYAISVAEHLRALLYNGLGRPADAVGRVLEHTDEEAWTAGFSARALSELVEAAVRQGNKPLATLALERLAGATQGAGTEWSLGVEARARALLSEDANADQLYRESIERLAGTALQLELARSRLVYGEWLRRQRRRADARAELRAALTMFVEMGAEGFATRTERALAATGERARKRTADTRDELTAQERQIARLARAGLSNPEIATQLFISPRTVEYHLGKVFAKLGLRTRGELVGVLEPADGNRLS